MSVYKWTKRQVKAQPTALWALITVTLMMWLGLGAILPIRTIYAEREGASMTEIGLMGSVFLLTQFVFQLPFGRFNDKWGRRPFILFAVLTHALLSVTYVFVNDPLWFIVVRGLEGIGAAAFTPAARAYISDVIVPEKRGEAFGLFGAALSGGILLGPAAGGFIGAAFGFTMPFIFCAVTGLVAVLLVIFSMPETHRPQPKSVAARPDKVSQPKISYFGLYFIGGYVIMFCLQFVMSLMGTVWNVWLNDQGDTLNQIGLSYTLFGLPSLIFTPYFGRLMDQNRHRANYFLWGGVTVSLVYAGYGLATGHFGIILILGLAESLFFALLQPISDRYIAEIVPATSRGTGQALISTFSTIGGFVGAMLTTYVYQFWIGAPFVAAAVVQLTGAIIGGIIMLRHEQRPQTGVISAAVANENEAQKPELVSSSL